MTEPMRPRDHAPGDRSHLERLLSEWAGQAAVPAGRLRRTVGVTVVMSMVEACRDPEGAPLFIFAGGAAMELRLGLRARTSQDLDAAYRGTMSEAAALIKAAIETDWHGFTGRAVAEETVPVPWMPVPPLRLQIRLAYKDKAFITIPFEFAPPEGASTHLPESVVPALRLDHLGLSGPERVPCLSVQYQIAQKIHACTDPGADGHGNSRVHDVLDILLLEELIAEDALATVREACVEVFGLRQRHAWPPKAARWDRWEFLWQALVDAREATQPLSDALRQLDELIARIDGARSTPPPRSASR